MAIDFERWNQEFGGEQAVNDLKKAKEEAGNFAKLPEGTYICKLEKLELGESKTKKPMVKAIFRILEGEYKKHCLFYNGVMAANDPSKNGFMMHKVLEFLRSLNVFDDSEIDFDGNYRDFNDLLLDIAEESEGLKFEISTEEDGDFTRIEIVDTFE